MKRLTAIALAGAGIAVAAEVALHAYLDLMYKETIPKGIFKIIMEKTDNGDYDDLHNACAESMKWVDAQEVENITLVNSRGSSLKGYLLMAEKPSKVFAVFAHGYRADHRGDPANFYKYYHDKGYNFLAVDHTAAGESEGSWVGFDYFESIDMLKWLDYLVDRFGEDIKIILHGVSMGGATVCKMADQIPPQVKLIVADCPYTSAKDEFTFVASGAGVNKTAPLILKGINFLNKNLAGYDLELTDVRQNVKNAKAPMLFVHGGSDDFVPTAMGKELYELCTSEKDLYIVDVAKHAESIVRDREGYLKKLDEFIEKYI